MSVVALQSFGFGDQLVRLVERDGAAWFVANDVCAALEIGNARQAVSRLDDDERDCVTISDAIGRARETTIISESGVYSLVFRSRKPVAVQFRKWVTGDVLPTLRRTGGYQMPDAVDATPDPLAATPDRMEALKIGLQLVREARNVFGRECAKRAWAAMGLPDLGDGAVDGGAINDERFRSINEWLAERADIAPGERCGCSALYADYVEWGRGRRLVMHTQTGFGRYLRSMGFGTAKGRTGQIYRIGLRLKAA